MIVDLDPEDLKVIKEIQVPLDLLDQVLVQVEKSSEEPREIVGREDYLDSQEQVFKEKEVYQGPQDLEASQAFPVRRAIKEILVRRESHPTSRGRLDPQVPPAPRGTVKGATETAKDLLLLKTSTTCCMQLKILKLEQ